MGFQKLEAVFTTHDIFFLFLDKSIRVTFYHRWKRFGSIFRLIFPDHFIVIVFQSERK